MILIFAVVIFIRKKYNRKTEKQKLKNLDTYLISLEKDKKRRDNLSVIPDYTFSVNGKNIDVDKLKKEGVLDVESKLKKGEIGCFLSHIHMLNKAIKSKHNYILILEDDAEIDYDYNISDKIKNIIKNAPKDFELLFLSHNYYEGYNLESYDFKKYEYFEQYEYYDYTEYKKVNLIYGTQSYVVNKKLLTKEKINKLYPIKKSYDVQICTVFKSYIIIPKIIKLSKYGQISNTQGIN
jgi:GR25 family glycosyltransferase involved in LPS biosynthesis